MSLRKHNLARHVDCSARSKMLQSTAVIGAVCHWHRSSGPPFFGCRLGIRTTSGAVPDFELDHALRDPRRTAPEHYGAFCSTASKELDWLSPSYGVAYGEFNQ